MLPKILLGVGIFAAFFSILIFSGKISIGEKQDVPQGEIVLWGTFPETEMNGIIQEFNPQAKTYRVTYREVSEAAFPQKLLEALANNNGPDLILAPYQTILSQSSRIRPVPTSQVTYSPFYFNEKGFKDTFVDGASIFFGRYGATALPISIEPMVLFYNRNLLSKHGIVNPPLYWNEVSADVEKITLQDSRGQFVESGIDLGAPNTPYAKDIIMTILAQLGQVPVVKQYDGAGASYLTVIANEPVTDTSEIFPLSEALRFFTQFADPSQNTTYTWNEFMGNADDQFVAEKLAMYIGYSGEFEILKARNRRAEIEMTSLPQSKGYTTVATGIRMYGIATMLTSKNITAAFAAQAELSGAQFSPKIAAIGGAMSPLRSFANASDLNPVIKQGMLVGRGWQDVYSRQSTNYTSTMISDVLNNRMNISDAANTFVSRMQDLYTPVK